LWRRKEGGLQYPAMRCYAPGPSGEANSAPPDLRAGYWGEERKGKKEGKRKGGKERARGKDREIKK